MQYAAVFPDPVRALARMSLFSNASGMDLAWIRVGWANPMSAKARRTLASSKCEKELKLVLDSTKDSSAIFQDMFAPQYEKGAKANKAGRAEGVYENSVGDFRHELCSRSLLAN